MISWSAEHRSLWLFSVPRAYMDDVALGKILVRCSSNARLEESVTPRIFIASPLIAFLTIIIVSMMLSVFLFRVTITSLVLDSFRWRLLCLTQPEILSISSAAVWMFFDPVSKYASNAYLTWMFSWFLGCRRDALIITDIQLRARYTLSLDLMSSIFC